MSGRSDSFKYLRASFSCPRYCSSHCLLLPWCEETRHGDEGKCLARPTGTGSAIGIAVVPCELSSGGWNRWHLKDSTFGVLGAACALQAFADMDK